MDELVSAVVLEWLIENSNNNSNIQSDVELAALSNVCRSWREKVSILLLVGNSKSFLLLPSMVRYTKKQSQQQEGEGGAVVPQHNSAAHADSFCAAWFHPDGLLTTPVSTQPLESSTNGDGNHNHRPSSKNQTVREAVFEWRGYRQASQVLAPFGYAASFLDGLIKDIETTRTQNSYSEENNNNSDESLQEEDQEEKAAHEPTAAVRGATYARPEGYCGCWDDSKTLSEAAKKNNERDLVYNKYSQVMRDQRRAVLQRQLLPRIVYSSMHKDMLHPTLAGRRQTAVQCLNSSGSSAVRLFTPPFACGPLMGRITLLCVGVATEDGCFLSGLKRRCEFGHMYPQSERNNLIDMSPVCIATDAVKAIRRYENNEDNGEKDKDSEDDEEEDEEDDDDEDDSSEDQGEIDEELFGCKCPFNPNTELYDTENDEMKPPDVLHRGQRGPGQWHCYVAIVDGIHSTIRVDGAEEAMDHLCRDEDKVDRARILLDGLSIGSDHSFDMSLCFGEGTPGEGEGAISELVVFQGRLPLPDVEALEQHLMTKHGISRTVASSGLLLQEEDEWQRDARALIEQSAPYHMTTKGVPLRVVAKDPSVAWHRTNEVTGENIQVARIGSRLSTGSSDW